LGGMPINDHWEITPGACIRHHVEPRCQLFDPYDSECPVPPHRLQHVCVVEMELH
jgi:hypothetical protein